MRFVVTLVVICLLAVTAAALAEEPSDSDPPARPGRPRGF